MQNVYSLYDCKAETYSNPFVANSDDEAKRILLDMCVLGGDNLISRHTEDYSVVRIGQFDKHTGLLDAQSVVTFIAYASQLVSAFNESRRPSNLTPMEDAPVDLVSSGS